MGAALMQNMHKKPSKNDDPVTLSHLLNLLDGLLECHGRILVCLVVDVTSFVI
jgi:hypothetical protein